MSIFLAVRKVVYKFYFQFLSWDRKRYLMISIIRYQRCGDPDHCLINLLRVSYLYSPNSHHINNGYVSSIGGVWSQVQGMIIESPSDVYRHPYCVAYFWPDEIYLQRWSGVLVCVSVFSYWIQDPWLLASAAIRHASSFWRINCSSTQWICLASVSLYILVFLFLWIMFISTQISVAMAVMSVW